jgi:hypothetical protein
VFQESSKEIVPELSEATPPVLTDGFSLDIDDIQLDTGGGSSFSDVPSLEIHKSSTVIQPKVSESPDEPIWKRDDDVGILRWTFRAPMNEYNMRRLQAVCILTEGDIPLRVISPSGSVLITDEAEIKVDPMKFKVLAEMFGLGS